MGSMVHPRAVAIFAIVCILRFGKSDYFYYKTICDYRKKIRNYDFKNTN